MPAWSPVIAVTALTEKVYFRDNVHPAPHNLYANTPELFALAPTDGEPHPYPQLHAQFSPPYRTRDRLKYLAGTELGAGMFAMDALPEEKAADLQAVDVKVED